MVGCSFQIDRVCLYCIVYEQTELFFSLHITCPPPFPSLISNVSPHHSPSSHSSFSAPNRWKHQSARYFYGASYFCSENPAHPLLYPSPSCLLSPASHATASVAVAASVHEHCSSDSYWSSTHLLSCACRSTTTAWFRLPLASIGCLILRLGTVLWPNTPL